MESETIASAPVSVFSVSFNDEEFVLCELTVSQDQEIAKLLRGKDLSGFTEFLQQAHEKPDEVNSGFAKALIEVLASEGLTKLLSIVLVPKSKPVYRKETAERILEYVGDLTNTQVFQVLAHFFDKNKVSGGNFLSFTSQALPTPPPQ